jgi:hypothetical protein
MELAPPIESGENSSDSPVAPQELPLFGRTV